MPSNCLVCTPDDLALGTNKAPPHRLTVHHLNADAYRQTLTWDYVVFMAAGEIVVLKDCRPGSEKDDTNGWKAACAEREAKQQLQAENEKLQETKQILTQSLNQRDAEIAKAVEELHQTQKELAIRTGYLKEAGDLVAQKNAELQTHYESNRRLDQMLRKHVELPERYGMPYDGVRQLICKFKDEVKQARMAASSAEFAVHEELNKLRAFKAYVHKRLDEAGVPVDPESPHKAQGCRVGGRLDIVLDRLGRTGTCVVNVEVNCENPVEFGKALYQTLANADASSFRKAVKDKFKAETVHGTCTTDAVQATQSPVDKKPLNVGGVVPGIGTIGGKDVNYGTFTSGANTARARDWQGYKHFRYGLNDVQDAVHAWAKYKGWLDNPRTFGETCMLFVTEVAELFEDSRSGKMYAPSTKIPDYSRAEEEAADIVIRVIQEAGVRNWRLSDAILAKMAYNETRPYRHGDKAC